MGGPSPLSLGLLLRSGWLLWLGLGSIRGIEVKWTPAEGDGPEPVSARYREQAARLRELQGEGGASPQMMQQGQPQAPQLNIFERMIVNTLIVAISAQRWAVAHPKLSVSAAGALVTYRSLKKAKERTGIMLSSTPLRSVFRPPIPHLASLLNGPFAKAQVTGDMEGATSVGFKGEPPAGTEEVFEEVQVGKGRRAYRFATQCLQTHKALDALQDMRFYTSEEGGEGVFVLKPGATWLLMPVKIGSSRGQAEPLAPPAPKKRKGKKKGRKGEAEGEEERGEWEEVTLQSLQGCPWKGELRLAAVYSPAGREGEEGSVSVQLKWLTTRGSSSLSAHHRTEIAKALVKKVKELVEKEHEVFQAREKQKEALLEGAKQADRKKAKKERDRLLHPEPNRAQLRRRRGLPGGDDPGLTRWTPGADFVEARRGRGRRG